MFSIGNSVLAIATIKLHVKNKTLLCSVLKGFLCVDTDEGHFCHILWTNQITRYKGVEKPVFRSAGGTAKSHLNRVCAEDTWPLTYLASYCVWLLLYIPACTQLFSSDVLFHLVHAQTVSSCTIRLG